jgi:hypothetical protein
MIFTIFLYVVVAVLLVSGALGYKSFCFIPFKLSRRWGLGFVQQASKKVSSMPLLMTNANVDMFGSDSISIKLEKMSRNSTSAAATQAALDYVRQAEEKASKSIVDSITGNRTMKAEALRLEAELDQLDINEEKLKMKMGRLIEIDNSIKMLIKGEITVSEMITSSELKFDEHYVLRIAELATMARTQEEQQFLGGLMEEVLRSEDCAVVTKRLLEKIAKSK